MNQIIKEVLEALDKDSSPSFHSDVLEKGKKLLKQILLKSLEYLSKLPSGKAVDRLSEYIDTYSHFENVLFGLNLSYRDHTLHSLWVYLFGHEWILEMGGYNQIKISGQLSVTFRDIRGPIFQITTEPLVPPSEGYMEATWGMIASLHDFGYPMEKFEEDINQIFGKILKSFSIDISSLIKVEIGPQITMLNESLSQLLSTVYRPLGLTQDETEKYSREGIAIRDRGEPLMKKTRHPNIGKDESIEMEFKIASLERSHSAWSAFLAFKMIPYLYMSDFKGGGDRDFLNVMIRREILYSILHHTHEMPTDEAVNRFSFILLFIDDIEDVLRYSHGGKPRGLRSDLCDVYWDIKPDAFQIKMNYPRDSEEASKEAEKKYEYLKKRYTIQNLRKGGEWNYNIIIEFSSDNFNEKLELKTTIG